MSPWPKNSIVKILAFLWILPYGIIGTLAALLFWALRQARPRIKDGAIDLSVNGWLGKKFSAADWGAFTLSWTILYWGDDQAADPGVRKHERQHVHQALRYGILYPIVYLIYGMQHGYKNNPFELEAYAKQDKDGW